MAGLFSQQVRAAPANPEPGCSDTTCTLTFEFRGEPYQWIPPSGIENLRFELFGGQGGQGGRTAGSGGFGARVAGQFIEVPQSLLVFVGGAGVSGSGAEGGYNGGGAAGVGYGDEGSGGGASDLRTSPSLEDRLVVAGAGGGSGGFNWASAGLGGSGGFQVAGAGGWGQAGPGSGGGQLFGGQGGQSVGGARGAEGSFGRGGNGASSRFSGGGGGGGGYYGGGGGGSDVNSAGFNGGGGGGGSSYTSPVNIMDVVHDFGVHTGPGRVLLTYDLAKVQETNSTDLNSDKPVDPTSEPAAPTPEPAAPTPEPAVPTPAPISEPIGVDSISLETEPVASGGEMPELAELEPIDLQQSELHTNEVNEVNELAGVVFLPNRQQATKLPTKVKMISQAPAEPPPVEFWQRDPPAEQAVAAVSPEVSVDPIPWVYSLSGLSLFIGLIRAIRSARRNRPTLAYRFVRIS